MNTQPGAGEAAVISTKQAAALLNVSVYTVTRWARSGKLEPAGKLEGRVGPYVFDLTRVMQLVEQRNQEAPDGGG